MASGNFPPATVQVFVKTRTLPEALRETAVAAEGKGKSSFQYRGVEFHFGVGGVYVLLKRVNQSLPSTFGSELDVNFVVIKVTKIPAKLLPKPGWYVGDNHGFVGARVMIDPDGSIGGDGPIIYANGDNFDRVVSFFKRVMTGKLEPGDKVRGTIHHSTRP